MVKTAETIDKVFPKILEFLGDDKETVVVAHNANFDVGFLKQNAKVLGLDFNYTYLDVFFFVLCYTCLKKEVENGKRICLYRLRICT